MPGVIETETSKAELATLPDGGTTEQAPAEKDPYFVRDGKAHTGAGEPAEASKPESTEVEPTAGAETNAVPAAQPAKAKQKTAGETWREIRAAEKEARGRAQALAEQQEALAADRKTFDESQALMRTNFRGWLKQNGLSLKEIIEGELEDQNVDPVKQQLAALAQQNKALEEKLAAIERDRQSQSEIVAAQQDETALVEHAKLVAEDYPLVSARIEKLAPRMRAAYYAHREATGTKPTMDQLFSHFENELTELGVTAPQKPSPTEQRSKNAASPARGKGTTRFVDRADGAREDGAGADPDAPRTLTNRLGAERASNGRKLTRDERVQLAASKLQLR